MNRLEHFYQITEFKNLKGLPEKIIQKEEELGESIGNHFNFRLNQYNDNQISLGKVNHWYFLGTSEENFFVFEDKRSILLFLNEQFNNANGARPEKDKLDTTWKNFWTREIQTL